MAFLLSSQNVCEYLVRNGFCTSEEKDQISVELKAAKNFNLLLSLHGGRQLLVKQEPHNSKGETIGEFAHEWRVQKSLEYFPELSYVRPWLPEVLHFNPEDSILVFNYLSTYCDLANFYAKEKVFPTEIAATIGTILATIHRATLNKQNYRSFFVKNRDKESSTQSPSFIRGLDRITPEVFGSLPEDGLRFFTLYQRYDDLGQTIAQLASAFHPCCLVHNDLKLNNILLHLNWKQILTDANGVLFSEKSEEDSIIRLIDWERCIWGDPAFDLGTLIASYLQIWLNSLVISKTISIEESLRLAMIPLELLQPSIATLTEAYFRRFPEILIYRPDFLQRVVQFVGLALIQQIRATLQYQKIFGNGGICKLQVAKSLLCRPVQSISTVFGLPELELTAHSLTNV